MGRHVVHRDQCSNKVRTSKLLPKFFHSVAFHSLFLFSVRVSNELGSGHPRAAKYSVIVTIVESLCIGLFFAALILATKNYFAIIFTDSKKMQEAVSRLAYLLGITMVLNSVQPVISGMILFLNLFQRKMRVVIMIW